MTEVTDNWFLFWKCLRMEKGHLSLAKILFNIYFFAVVLMIDPLS